MAAGAEPLPSNGASWHHIRQGNLPHIPQALSGEFYGLLKVISPVKRTDEICMYLKEMYGKRVGEGKWRCWQCHRQKEEGSRAGRQQSRSGPKAARGHLETVRETLSAMV